MDLKKGDCAICNTMAPVQKCFVLGNILREATEPNFRGWMRVIFPWTHKEGLDPEIMNICHKCGTEVAKFVAHLRGGHARG